MKEKFLSDQQVRRRSIFAFVFFVAAFSLGIFAWKKIKGGTKDRGIPTLLRKGLSANENIFGSLFSKEKLIQTYPTSEAVTKVRVNGNLGLKSAFDADAWRLQVVKQNGDTSVFTLKDIRALPKTEVVFDFKCIEGWSQKTWWGGVRFSDFIKAYHLEEEARSAFVGLHTPDNGYYVGIDMPSILQPQTLLCYEMNGKPLPMNQGYPLRLIIPVKYGIKHLKRIGTIFFSNQRPPDYWAEQGYDYYSGH